MDHTVEQARANHRIEELGAETLAHLIKVGVIRLENEAEACRTELVKNLRLAFKQMQDFTDITFCKKLYLSGAHVGNVYCSLSVWGTNSLQREAEVFSAIGETINQLNEQRKTI